MPAIKYAVTAGRLTSLARRESSKPDKRAMERDRNTVEVVIVKAFL
jgi:hypothetical protein